MNKKAWWQKIKYNYPLTLADCKGFFEMRFRNNWRAKMQDYHELLPYFQEKYITIDLRPLYRGIKGIKYSYKLYAIGIIIHTDPLFKEREAAAFDALEFAFRCREQFLEKRQLKASVQFTRKRKVDIERKAQEPDKKTLGERSQQKKYD